MTKSAGHNPGGRTANAHQMMLSGPDGRVLDEYQKVDVIVRTADVECVVVTVRGGDRFPFLEASSCQIRMGSGPQL